MQFTLLWHLTNKSQQTSTHSKFIGTCHYKYFKISTHHTNTQKTTLASYQTKNRLQNLSSHIQNPSNSSPDTPDTQSLANSFLQFFSDKIERIRSKFSPSDSPDPFLFPIIPPPNLSNFDPTTFSFSLLKTNNVNLTQFLLSFWNSVLTKFALLSLIS